MTTPIQQKTSTPITASQSLDTGGAVMTADDLMIWLKSRNSQMWDEIGAATKGVNARQHVLDDLTAVSTAKSNQEGLNACNQALADLPADSPDRSKLEALRDKYQARLDNIMAHEAQKNGDAVHDAAVDADCKAQIDADPNCGPFDFDKFQAGAKDLADQYKADINQENQQTTVLLQKTMNDAQEAMGEASSILKGIHDTSMGAIHNIA